jgi:alpha-L-arabinofuranosidase
VVNVRGPLFVHPKGIVKRTTFHALRMYSDLLQPNVIGTRVVSEPLQIDGTTVPGVDAVTTCSEDRKQVAIAMINRHPELPASLKLNGLTLTNGKLTILSGDSTDAYNDVAHPTRVVPYDQRPVLQSGSLQLPPHSVAILQASI